jgi:hypothetical protein
LKRESWVGALFEVQQRGYLHITTSRWRCATNLEQIPAMPLNWNAYDEYFTDRERAPISEHTKRDLEVEAAALLELSPEQRETSWGICTLPGCYGMVIQLRPDLRHRWNPDMDRAVGLKIFHADSFGKQAKKLVPFHTDERCSYPGLPNPQVQAVYDGGRFVRALPREQELRWYLIQEWVEGDTWDEVIQLPTFGPDDAATILRSLFEGIIFPLWSVGVIWWDIRANNYCVRSTPSGLEVVMIDTDSLQAYSDEIRNRPNVHNLRNVKKATGVKRLKTMITGLVDAVTKNLKLGRESKLAKSSTEDRVRDFLDVLGQPGALKRQAAQDALNRMIDCFKTQTWIR